VRANVVFFFLNPVALLLGGFLSGEIARHLGGPRMRVDLTLIATGPASRFALAFVPFLVFDFFYYWFHRSQHAWPWLWQVHRLHHSEHCLNVTTNYRHHWLEEFFWAFFIFLSINLLILLLPVFFGVAVAV